MNPIHDVLSRGNARFRQEVMPQLRERFDALVQGQAPHTFFVACSDSRVLPNLLTHTLPGELFVVRNAGNLVPPHGEDEALAAALEFAVEALGVRHVAVCGHSGCGAMRAVVQPEAAKSLPQMGRWLRLAEPTREALREQGRDEQALTFAVEHNARAQLDNLATHPCVQRRFQSGEMTLTAWVYHIGTGELRLLERRGGGAS